MCKSAPFDKSHSNRTIHDFLHSFLIFSHRKDGLADDSSENSNSQEFHPEQQKKLDYLLKQAEIMAHFVTNSSKANKRKATTAAQSKK